MSTDTPQTRYYLGCRRTQACEELPRPPCRRKQCDYPNFKRMDVSIFRDQAIFLLVEVEAKDTIKNTIRAAVAAHKFVYKVPKPRIIFATGYRDTDPKDGLAKTYLQKVQSLMTTSPAEIQIKKLPTPAEETVSELAAGY